MINIGLISLEVLTFGMNQFVIQHVGARRLRNE